MINGEMRIFAGSACTDLGSLICASANIHMGKIYTKRFEGNDEFYCQFLENIRSKDVFLVQSFEMSADKNLMELLIMIDAAKRASAQRITAVIPFFGYSRQDKKTRSRIPISARLVADLIEKAGAHRVMTLDLHAAQIQGFFNIPVDHLYASHELVRFIQPWASKRKLTIVSPDLGGAYRAAAYAEHFGTDFIFVPKNKAQDDVPVLGNLDTDSQFLVVDDIIETGSTIVNAAKQLHSRGAKKVRAAVSHINITEEGRKSIMKCEELEHIYTTNSTTKAIELAQKHPNKFTTASVHPLFSTAIMHSNAGHTISSLFSEGGKEDRPPRY